MKTVRNDQLALSFYPNSQVVVNFQGGEITSDAGLLLVREFDKRWKLTKEMNKCIQDERVPYLVKHEVSEMLRQRIYQIIAGYEDVDDCDLLRNDPTMKLVAGNLSEPLSSQPTISRFENSITWEEIEPLNDLSIDWFIKTRSKKPKEILLDLDSTDDPAYGEQQLVLFNGFYDQYMYHPLLLFEGKTGHLLSTILRRGNAPASECASEMIKKTIDKLRAEFSGARFLLRGDSGFGVPELYELCEEEDVGYALGIRSNSVLKEKAQKVLRKAKEKYKKTGKPAKCFTSFWYGAKSWGKRRRICVKAEVNSEGTNLRFLVTNLRGSSTEIFSFHNERGECENRIKEFKLGFHADRLSCQTYMANAFRLAMHALSYNLVNLFREKVLHKTELAKAQIDTLRMKLFKIGAWVGKTVRRIWVKLSSGWPYRNLLKQVYVSIAEYAPPIRC